MAKKERKTQIERQDARLARKARRKLGDDSPEAKALIKEKLANRKQRTKEFIRMGVGLDNEGQDRVVTEKMDLSGKYKALQEERKKKANVDAQKTDEFISSMETPLQMKPVTSLIKTKK